MRLRAKPEGAAARVKGAVQPASDTPWREAPWCAVDLELTGLDAGDELHVARADFIPEEAVHLERVARVVTVDGRQRADCRHGYGD